MFRVCRIPLLFLFVALIYCPSAFAVGSAGFENASFSAESLAQSNATVAQANEPAAISYNPAGIVDLPGVQIQSETHLISSITVVHNTAGSSTQSRGTINPIPTAYVSINPGKLLNNRLAVGIGFDSPFGLSKEYDSNHEISKYAGYSTWLKMYSIKPVIAMRVTKRFKIGAGPIYYDVFDFGGAQAYPNKLVVPGSPDGDVDVVLSGNTWAWQLGALYDHDENNSFGFYFRSPATVLLKGRAEVEGSSFFGGSGNFKTGAKTKLDLPLNFTFAYARKFNEQRTTLEVDFGFTRWAARERQFIDTDPSGSAFDDLILAAIGKNNKDWRNAFSLHVGGNHKYNEKLTLMAGTLFYWTPVPKTSFLPGVPDSNRIGFSLGAKYRLTESLDVSASYIGLLSLRRRIDNDIAVAVGGSVDGTYYSYTQVFSLGLKYRWDDLFETDEGDVEMYGNKR